MLTLLGAGQPQNGKGTEERFVISVKTDNTGTSNDDQFTLPWIGTYDVNWGDGTSDSGVTNTQTHTYASPGTYDVKVTATTGRISFNNGGDKLKLLDIKNWGTCQWTTMSTAFRGCTSLTGITATDAPNLSNTTDLSNMFWKCRLSNADFSNWDVSNITNISLMFSANGANGTINLSNWDVSNVTNMYAMFYDCNTLQITGIDNWDTDSLVNIQQMFKSTSLLDISFANWNINSITNLSGFLSGSLASQPVLSTTNYDSTLISWAAQTPQQNRNVSFGGSQYSYEAAAARQTLINTYGWTITDGGQFASLEFVISVKTDNIGGSADDQFTLPWVGTYDVDWGDGNQEIGVTNTQTHTYATAGTYDVAVTAATGNLRFRSSADPRKLIKVKNWGTCVWTTFQQAFFGCKNLTELPLGDVPNLSQVTTFLSAFSDCNILTNWGTISEWDFSNANSMVSVFYQASSNSSEISNFNISNWDFSNVTDFRLMYRFYRDGIQTADIGNPNNWNVSNVITLSPFTGDMNIDTSTWNFSSWDVSSATSASVFDVLGLTPDNYDATLISWAAQPVNNNVTCNFGSSKYTLGGAAEAARNTLINTYNWTITDAGGVYKPVSGLLFDYPNPTSAYSLRALATFQGGIDPVVVRVRRSSDNVEQDFTSTEITDGTLISFTGANDGFVSKIYDQTYELQHIYQNTATRQAKIVDGGSLILEGGLPCIQPAGGYQTLSGENLNYYTNENSFTYHLQKPDGSVVANNEFFIDSAGAAEYGREGFSFGNTYARINYPFGSTISSISYNRNLTDDIYQLLVWESYPSSLILNDRLKLYNQNGLLADGNTSNTVPTGQGSTRIASFFAAEGGTFRTLEGNWQETILYKEENIPNRNNFLTSISEYYTFPATSGLLFDYPGASAAYSLRNLANNVTNVVRVRRSSDNTEQDFTAVEITDGTLTTFTGVNDGFVTTWYDQSGNSNNAVQATATLQPKLVTSGVVELENGKPCVKYDPTGAVKYLNFPETTNLFSVYAVGKAGSNSSIERFVARPNGITLRSKSGVYDSTPDMFCWFYQGQLFVNGVDGLSPNPDISTTSQHLVAATTTPGGTVQGQSRISGNSYGGRSWMGTMQEIILYNEANNPNRTGIETNINTEYTIY